MKKGDKIKVSKVKGNYWCIGTVISADNAKMPWEENDNWYLEIDVMEGNIPKGYTYWKQKYDGGEVEILNEGD